MTDQKCDETPEYSEEHWREVLTDEQFRICREGGTERPFTGKLLMNKANGTYSCVCCGADLFTSNSKFDSGCGWPSFDTPQAKKAIKEYLDTSLGMVRTEIRCASCDSHLGHVFTDGPTTTGLRYCVNSVSLNFKEK